MRGPALQLFPHPERDLRDRTVLRSLPRCQEPIPQRDSRVLVGERHGGTANKGAAASIGPVTQAEELQEPALLQTSPRQLTLHEGCDLLHLQEIPLPEEVLPLLRKGREVRGVLHLPRVPEHQGRGLGVLGIAEEEMGALWDLQTLRPSGEHPSPLTGHLTVPRRA